MTETLSGEVATVSEEVMSSEPVSEHALAAVPGVPVGTDAATEPARVRWWKGTLFAALLLAAFYAVALGVLVGGGAIVHAVSPKRHMDVFALFHNPLVVAIVLGVSVLFLIPPHPWAKRLFAPDSQKQAAPTATRTNDGATR